jgi:GNAT superfamily N-acetyltransferase
VNVARISIGPEPADSDDVRRCFERYYAELDRRFEGGFDVAAALPLGLEDLTPPRGLVLVARLEGAPVGCGAVKLGVPDVAEIKRMWVSPEARGRGLGGRILAQLEARGVVAGKTVARLETNRSLVEAVAMYRRRGYREVAPFNDEPHADHWFEKRLLPSTAVLSDPPQAGSGQP